MRWREMPFARLSHTQRLPALSAVPDLTQARQHHSLLAWGPAWHLLWDLSPGGHTTTEFTLVCVPGMNWEQFAWLFSDRILPPAKAQRSSATDSKDKQQLLAPSGCFPLPLLCSSACLLLWPTFCGFCCISKCALASVIFLPHSLLPSGLLLYKEHRNTMKRKIQDRNLANLAGKDNLACKQTFRVME